MNTVLLSGTVAVAATQKTFQSGATLTTATVRVERYARKGEAPAHDDVPVEAWHDAGKALLRAPVGSRVLVAGKVRVNTWTAQDGSPRSRTSITADNVEQLAAAAGAPEPPPRDEEYYDAPTVPASAAAPFTPQPGDEIPF